MEIIEMGYRNNPYIEFKIDLIVWKSRPFLVSRLQLTRFKIDLIVWKSSIPMINNINI